LGIANNAIGREEGGREGEETHVWEKIPEAAADE